MTKQPSFGVGGYTYIPGIRRASDECSKEIEAYVLHNDGEMSEIRVCMESLTAKECEVIKAGSLINLSKSRSV